MAKYFLLVLLLVALLGESGCVFDEYYTRSFYPVPSFQVMSLPDCRGCTPAEELEYWRRLESLEWQEYNNREQKERSRGAVKAGEVWKERQRILYGK